MNNKMRWVRNGADVLLQVYENGLWLPYNQSQHHVSDYPIAGGSRGYATAQKLLKLGYVYESGGNGVIDLNEEAI